MKNSKPKIWFFGDSTTQCHGLKYGYEYFDNYSEKRKPLWTKIISDYFECNPVNFSMCGASNNDIQFRIVTQLQNIKSDDVVIMQSAYPTRTNIFTETGEFKSIHALFDADILLKDKVKDNDIKTFKKYHKTFVEKYHQEYEIRDLVFYISIKKELEQRGVRVIFWSHGIIDNKIKKHMGWTTIKDETNGKINDENLGFDSQEKFAKLIIDEYENQNTFIYPNPKHHLDIKFLSFDYNDFLKKSNKIFEFVGRRDNCRDYNENFFEI
jgi:hypothetical protein